MQHLLLTGASGFIGSSFVEEKADRYSIKTFSFQKERLVDLSFKGIDTVLHLAALVHQPNSGDDEKYMKVNYHNTLDLAKKAKKEGVKQFVFMSSIKVYGEESKEACFCEASECRPVDAYGKSKLEAEKALLLLQDNEFFVSIIRTPVVYGAKVKANILSIVKLISCCPYLPFAKIVNRRSMVYIGNLIQLIDLIANKRVQGIFLASDPELLSTSDFFSLISQALYGKSSLFYLPGFSIIVRILRPRVFQRLYTDLCIDASQTQKILSFTPRFTTREGVKKMVEWYKNEH